MVVWETLARRRLFDGVTDLELFVKVGEGKVPSLRDERGDLPEDFHIILETLMAKSADERFQ
ncbi:MAG: hypothetical protein AAGE52_02295, partial [Myxococcota bacterium]